MDVMGILILIKLESVSEEDHQILMSWNLKLLGAISC
jgi:hypothetical protein